MIKYSSTKIVANGSIPVISVDGRGRRDQTAGGI